MRVNIASTHSDVPLDHFINADGYAHISIEECSEAVAEFTEAVIRYVEATSQLAIT